MSINILNIDRVMGKVEFLSFKLLVWLLFIILGVCVIFIVCILFIFDFKNLFCMSYIFWIIYFEINY